MILFLCVFAKAQECLDLGDVRTADATKIVEAVKEHGVVVVRDQYLSRQEQVELSGRLGEVVILPPSFEGLDPEPGQPAIQRVTNYWANGTWKGKRHSFGAYWHQDGQFWPRSHRWILSMLSCAAAPDEGGETGFAFLRGSLATLNSELRAEAEHASIRASVRDIADFSKGLKEELDLFDDVTHPVVDSFPGGEGTILYVGSPHMRLEGTESKTLINDILDHATQEVYYHQWRPGDLVIWDNVQMLHKAHPYNNTADVKRELYRTQFRLKPDQAHLDAAPSASLRFLKDDGTVVWG